MHSLTSWRLVPARGAVVGSLASGLLGQLMLLVSGILVARTLGPTDRGYLALLVLLPAVLQHIGTLGLPLATTYFIARDEARRGRRSSEHRTACGRAGDRPRRCCRQDCSVLLLEGDPDSGEEGRNRLARPAAGRTRGHVREGSTAGTGTVRRVQHRSETRRSSSTSRGSPCSWLSVWRTSSDSRSRGSSRTPSRGR